MKYIFDLIFFSICCIGVLYSVIRYYIEKNWIYEVFDKYVEVGDILHKDGGKCIIMRVKRSIGGYYHCKVKMLKRKDYDRIKKTAP